MFSLSAKGTITILLERLFIYIFLAKNSRLKTDGSKANTKQDLVFAAYTEYKPIFAPTSHKTAPTSILSIHSSVSGSFSEKDIARYAQSLFGVGAHVSDSTRYWFRLKATISRASGTNNTALTLGWRGTATLSKLNYTAQGSIGAVSTPTSSTTYETTLVSGFTTQNTVTGTSNPPDSTTLVIQGMIDVGAAGAGYVEPFISWTGAGAPGSVTVSSLSYFQLFPLGVTGANTSVGNWG